MMEEEKLTVVKPKEEKEEYILEDKDFLLIKALQDLAAQIRRLALK